MYIHYIYTHMLKRVNLVLEEEQYNKLVKKKKKLGLNWTDFIMQLVED